MKEHIIIAVDGTAASGKGTLAKRLAADLNFAYLDTGKLYRFVGYKLMAEGFDPKNQKNNTEAIRIAENLASMLQPDDLITPALTNDDTGQAASIVAAIPEVRTALVDYQKNFPKTRSQEHKGTILDGRDIGTVICPQADLKLYIDAKTEIRAQRRFKELQSKGNSVTYDAVLADMLARDERDSNRAAAPMKPADDAIKLDTSDMNIDDVFAKVRGLVKDRTGL